MTFYRVLRKKHEEDVPPHEHQTDEVNGVFGFLRALKGKIDGSFRVTGDLIVGPDSDLIIGDEDSTEAQLKIHNVQSHISLFETDDPEYPDKFLRIDVNGQVYRVFWTDSPSTFYERFRVYGPTHATKAHDIEFVDSAGNIVMAWDQSDGRWELTTDLVGDTDNDFYSRSFRTRVGPDASDFWIIGEQNSGDTIRIAQWDQSAGTNLARFDFNGRGTGVSNAGDMIFYDEGGTEILRWDQSALAFLFAQGVLQAEDGSAGSPVYSFNTSGREDDGIYSPAASQLGITLGGTARVIFTTSQIQAEDGAVGAPAYSFNNTGRDDDGMWSPAAGEIAFSSGGAEVLRIDQAGVTDHKNVGIVKARAQNLSPNTISTSEAVEETATLTIPTDWNGYDIEAMVQTDVFESGTLTAIRVISLRIRMTDETGTVIGLTEVEIDTVDPNRWSGVVQGYLTGQTATGSVAVVFTTAIPADTGQASTDNTTFIVTAYRTS